MTDQQHGHAGWPPPADPGRPQAAGGASNAGGQTRPADDDAPWFDDGYVAYDSAEEPPWDRPTDMPWPEPELDFNQWVEPRVPPMLAGSEQQDPASPQVASEASATQLRLPLTHSPAYPAPTEAPYARPSTPPYASPFNVPFDAHDGARRPDPEAAPYATAGRPLYVPAPAGHAGSEGRPAVQANSAPLASEFAAAPANDPYDEFAPLAEDLTRAPRTPGSAPAEPATGQPRPSQSTSVFGDLFGSSSTTAPARRTPPPTPPQFPRVEPPAPSQPDPVPAKPAEAQFDSEEMAADFDRNAFEFEETPANPGPELRAPQDTEPTPDWPPVPSSFAPKPWESVTKPSTPWGGPGVRPMPGMSTQASMPIRPAAPPYRPAPAHPSPPARRPLFAARTDAQRPAPPQPTWRAQPTQSAAPPPAVQRPPSDLFMPRVAPEPAPAPPAQPELASGRRPVSDPAQAAAERVSSDMPLAAASSDVSRAPLAEHATAEELWFLSPQSQAHTPLPAEAEADTDGDGSTLSTWFWTIVTGLLVVALVLAFLHFLTGVFR